MIIKLEFDITIHKITKNNYYNNNKILMNKTIYPKNQKYSIAI